MELITYRGLQLTIIQSIGWEREPLHDQAGNTTYECTRIRGSVIVSYNPGAISYQSRPNTPSTVPAAQTPGRMPVETDGEIRRFLEQPRGELTVTSAGRTWLTSPSEGMTCDVRNGPFVKVNSIQKIPGERLWQIHLEIETFINEFPNDDDTELPPLIISNRWYASDTVNWQHLRTRVIQGVCTVRADVLQSLAESARYVDYLRGQFAGFSVPLGFQREEVKVTVTPDGNSAHYTVVDVEQLFNKSSNCPAVKIQVSDTNWLWAGSAGRAMNSLGGLAGIGLEFTGNLSADPLAVLAASARQMMRVAGVFNSNMPKAYRSCHVVCHGNQRTKRAALLTYALAVARTRVGVPSILSSTTSELLVNADTNNMVSVTYTVSFGLDFASNFVGGTAGQIADFFTQQVTGSLTLAQQNFELGVNASADTTAGGYDLVQTRLLPNVAFPEASGTRGTAASAPSTDVGTLITQVLEGFDEAPAAIP